MEDTVLLRQVRDRGRIRASDLIAGLVRDWAPLESPDPALIAGTGRVDGHELLVLGQEKPKGKDLEAAQAVNFGMMRAIGYWYVVEQLELAARAGRGVLTLIDTPGADPAKGGVEQLVAWAVAASTASFIRFPGPSISVVIGEGGSGGALALQVSDQRLMVSDAFYSVISPESCSAILFRDNHHVREAMAVLKPDAEHVRRTGVVDTIVDWSGRVAIDDHTRAIALLADAVHAALAAATDLERGERLKRRREACFACGRLAQTADEIETQLPAAPPPEVRKFADADKDDHSIATLRQAYFAEQGIEYWPEQERDLTCPIDAGGCGATFSREQYARAGWACRVCGRGERLGAPQWLELMCDAGSVRELFRDLDLSDLDEDVYDSPTYQTQRRVTREMTGAQEALVTGVGTVGGAACALAVSDFRFMGGTLGAAAGEKLRLICELARARQLPLVSLVCSGGVRMQDGTLGLVQMAKTTAAVQDLMASGLPHIVVMADPCTGGAMASYATTATHILAEPRALLAFAGPRVMELAGIPVDVRRLLSEEHAKHGGIDEIVPRRQLRERLRHFLAQPGDRDPTVLAASARVRRSRALARRSVSAWIGDFVNQLNGILDGTRGVVAARGPTEYVQANVVSQLADLAAHRIPALLAQATRSDNARVRANAVAALARLPADAAPMEHALGDSHHRVRAEAALGLLRRDAEHADAIVTVHELLGDDDPASRRHGLYVVVGAPYDAFRAAVSELAEDPEPGVRLAAGVAMAALGETEAGAAVIQEIMAARSGRGDWRVRQLLPMLSPGAAEDLMRLLDLT